jgi:hypothetical protein
MQNLMKLVTILFEKPFQRFQFHWTNETCNQTFNK